MKRVWFRLPGAMVSALTQISDSGLRVLETDPHLAGNIEL
jgi:hypothetical protein